MKNAIHLTLGVLLAALVLVFTTKPTVAQDPAKVAPNVYKVLLENDRVRVLEVHAKPGEKIPMHSHPDYVVYPLGPAKVKFVTPDTTVVVELKAGEVSWHEAEKHAPEVIGTTEAHVLVVELKEPHKAPKKMMPKK